MCGLPAGAIAAAAAGCLLRRRLDLIRCRRCGPNDITHKRTQAYTPVHTHTHTHKRLLWRLADFIIFVFLSAFRRRRRRDAQSFGRHHHSIRPALRCDRSAKLFGAGSLLSLALGVASSFVCVCVCVPSRRVRVISSLRPFPLVRHDVDNNNSNNKRRLGGRDSVVWVGIVPRRRPNE